MSRVSERWTSDRVGREVQVLGGGRCPRRLLPHGRWRRRGVRAVPPRGCARATPRGGVDQAVLGGLGTGDGLAEGGQRVPAATRAQAGFDAFVTEELVPAIARDCGGVAPADLGLIATGASIGAYNALAAICRHPELFHGAFCMSGTYELSKFIDGDMDEAWYFASPLHFVPNMAEDSPELELLRASRPPRARHRPLGGPRGVLGRGRVLGSRGIPNHVDEWGDDWDHDWPTWRRMLPQYLRERLSGELCGGVRGGLMRRRMRGWGRAGLPDGTAGGSHPSDNSSGPDRIPTSHTSAGSHAPIEPRARLAPVASLFSSACWRRARCRRWPRRRPTSLPSTLTPAG